MEFKKHRSESSGRERGAQSVKRAHHYKVGDQLMGSHLVVETVVGQSDRAGVFLTNRDSIAYEWYEEEGMPEKCHAALARCGTLSYLLNSSVPQKKRYESRKHLANALRFAFHCGENDDPLAAFNEVQQTIIDIGKVYASYRYLVGSVIAAAILIGGSIVIRRMSGAEIELIVYGAAGGTIGALLSVLLRIRDLALTNLAPLWFAAIQGGSKIVMGFLFGAVLIITIKANIVLGVVQGNPYATVALAIVAGFSERFAPELLKSIEDRQMGSNRNNLSGQT
jgi:hypothetical protein